LFSGCVTAEQQKVKTLNEEGVAALHRQNYALAQQRFQEANTVQPGDATTIHNLGNVAHRQGDFPEAERFYRQVLERQPDHGPSRHGLGLALVQQHRTNEAWRMLDEWAKQRPQLADAHAELGWLLRENGDGPAAQAELHKALELDAGNVRALLELGLLYEGYSYPDRARSLFERASQRDPHNPDIKMHLARLKSANEKGKF
jgi:Flp pilus assembly protein TadD